MPLAGLTRVRKDHTEDDRINPTWVGIPTRPVPVWYRNSRLRPPIKVNNMIKIKFWTLKQFSELKEKTAWLNRNIRYVFFKRKVPREGHFPGFKVLERHQFIRITAIALVPDERDRVLYFYEHCYMVGMTDPKTGKLTSVEQTNRDSLIKTITADIETAFEGFTLIPDSEYTEV